MAASSRAQVLRLYRALLRESQRFGGYNYRMYAIRRIRDAFRENKNIKDSEKIEELVNKAKANLEVIHRQGYEIDIQLKEFLLGAWEETLDTHCPVFHKKNYDLQLITEICNLPEYSSGVIIQNKTAGKNFQLFPKRPIMKVTIGQLYSTQKLVIESPGNT